MRLYLIHKKSKSLLGEIRNVNEDIVFCRGYDGKLVMKVGGLAYVLDRVAVPYEVRTVMRLIQEGRPIEVEEVVMEEEI